MAMTDPITDLISIAKDAIANISQLDDLIDNYIEPITDITDTIGHVVAPIKALRSLYTTSRKLRFKAFIRSYSQVLISQDTDRIHERMTEYARRPKTRELIYQTINDAVQSRSIYAARILGHIAGLALLSREETDLKLFIIVSGLKELNDLEIQCAVRIFEISNHAKTNDVKKVSELLGAQFEYTVERLKRLLLLEPGEDRTYDSPGDWGKYAFTEITEDLIDLMKEEGIYSELLANEKDIAGP